MPINIKDLGEFITREEATKLLEIPMAELKEHIANKRIRVRKHKAPGHMGRPRMFCLKEDILAIQRLAKTAEPVLLASEGRFTPEEASLVFAALSEGKSCEECVIALKIHPQAVLAIHRSWCQFRGGIFLTKRTVDLFERLGFDGVFPLENEEQVKEVLEAAAQDKACSKCKKRTATMCRPCVRASEAVAAASEKAAPDSGFDPLPDEQDTQAHQTG